METSTQLRGKLYNTNMAYRCPNFSKCKMCSCCDNYNRHHHLCKLCEAGKPEEMLCHHTDDQQTKFVYVMEMFNRPISHIDDHMTDVPTVANAKEEEIDNIVKSLNARKL